MITSAFDTAQEVTKLNVASGLSVERLQELREVGKATGAEIDDIADASRELTLRLAEAAELDTGPAVDALNILGVSLDQLAGLSEDERFAFIRDRLSETTDEAQRLFAAEELLGGSSERLAGLIGLTAAELDKQSQAARESGAVLERDVIAKNNEAAVAVDKAKGSLAGLAGEFVSVLTPAIVAVTARTLELAGSFDDATEERSSSAAS